MNAIQMTQQLASWVKTHPCGDSNCELAKKAKLGILNEFLQKTNVLELVRLQLNSLTDLIGELSGLEQLNVSHNNLVTIPAVVGRLSHITVLDLSNNQLSSIPSEIGQLKKLQQLSLSNNKISALPPSIGDVKNLTLLEVSHNPELSDLPDSLHTLPFLVQLFVKGTKIDLSKAGEILAKCMDYRSTTYYTLLLQEEINKWRDLAGVTQVWPELKGTAQQHQQLYNYLQLISSKNQTTVNQTKEFAVHMCRLLEELHSNFDTAFDAFTK